jgi:hypothetical protein
MTDPELRRLFKEASRASETLVARLERYGGDLVPARPNEASVADDLANYVLFVERQFRGWYERSRNVREMLEDPDFRPAKEKP